MQGRYAKWGLPPLGTLAVAGCILWAGGWPGPQAGHADQRPGSDAQAARDGAPDALILVYPTGDRATSSLMVEALGPADVPVGKSYEYTIRVTNLTRNLILQDVEIHQQASGGFSIEDSRVLGREEESAQDRDKSQGQNPGHDKGKDKGKGQSEGQGQGRDTAKSGDDGQNEDRSGESHRQGSSGQSGHQGTAHWKVERLGPGESRAIRVTAVGDEEGMASSCIQVSYRPTLCVQTRFIKPEVQLSKSAPDRADICEPLAFRYTLANTGSGAARDLVIRDELPEGLTTADGKKAVEIRVGDLAAGRSIDREVRIQASRPGDYASRAIAKGAGDLSARSPRTSTKVVQAKLAATIEGPSVQYVGRPITYQVRVKNDGDATAVDARLQVDVDQKARVIRLSRAQPGDIRPSEASGQTLTWALGDLEPGKERTVSFTAVGGSKADFEHTARATSACAAGGDLAKAATATQTVTTTVLTFPALVLEMVDQNDPVQVGGEETYTIAVRNQGSGPDQDVKVVVELPERLSFVSADGPTKATADGSTVAFEPIDRLEPGERAVWKLRAKAERAGDVRTRAELSSDYLSEDSPGISVEPTRLIE